MDRYLKTANFISEHIRHIGFWTFFAIGTTYLYFFHPNVIDTVARIFNFLEVIYIVGILLAVVGLIIWEKWDRNNEVPEDKIKIKNKPI